MAYEDREFHEDGLLEATNGTRVRREPAAHAPARSEIRIVSSNRIERVPTNPVVLADGVPVVTPAETGPRSAPRVTPEGEVVPTLHVIDTTDAEWKDLSFFNIRFQAQGAGSERRIVVRQLDRAGGTEQHESARWSGDSIEAASTWMRSRLSAQESAKQALKPRPVQCQIDITQVYAFQDPEEIDPRPLNFDGASLGATLSQNCPLTLSVALAIAGPDAEAIVHQDKRCRVAVYAKAFPSGVRSEVGSFVLDVGAAVGNWVARVPIKINTAGRYRLSIVASLEAPLSGVGYREIPMVQVS